MPEDTDIRVALVGCGNIGVKGHIPAYQRIPNARITAVCDVEPALAHSAAGLTGARAYDNVDDLFATEQFDAVDICTPPWTHAELAIRAAQDGKHVLCEKPIAPSLDDADAMIAAARDGGINLMVGQTRRFDHRYRTIKDQITGGQIGRPVYVRRAERQFLPFPAGTWYWDTSVGGGVILDIGVHTSDLLRWLFDSEPVEIRATAKAVGQAAQDANSFDYAQITYKFAAGGIGFAETSWAHPGEFGGGQYAALDVLGTEGKIEYNDRDSNPMLSYELDAGLSLPRYFSLMSSTEYAFAAEVAAFVAGITNGTDPIVDPSDARAAVAMALAAQESAVTGRAVRFDEPPTIGKGVVVEGVGA